MDNCGYDDCFTCPYPDCIVDKRASKKPTEESIERRRIKSIEKSKRYYQSHKEECKEKSNIYRKNHLDQYAQYHRIDYKLKKEKRFIENS